MRWKVSRNLYFIRRLLVLLCLTLILGCHGGVEHEVQPATDSDSAQASKVEFCNNLKERRLSSKVSKFVTELLHEESLNNGDRVAACHHIEIQKTAVKKDLWSYVEPGQSDFECSYLQRDSITGVESVFIQTKETMQQEYDDLMDWFESLRVNTPC